ncbi:hypothetical protein ACTZWW_21540 [Salinarimonas sp. NSM]|uniref:hypothetical protein n=1 Tax=Salinarimonas sp. NSM TaxID=3458003 RepID=UPI0040375262
MVPPIDRPTQRAPQPVLVDRPRKERTLPIDKDVFAHRLWQAIKRSGLTYRETARLAQERLPQGLRISDVSVWSYAKGRSLPRRMAQIEALAEVLGVGVGDLVEEVDSMRAHAPGYPPNSGTRVEDLGDGRARLVVDLTLPWDRAIAALRLLKGDEAVDAIEAPAAERAPSVGAT